MEEKIEFDKPADEWSHGLLLGNGHMGCVIYGGVRKEQIDLSEITFFSGEKSLENNQKNGAKAFHKMRSLVSLGEYEKAREISKDFIGVRHNYGTNLPVGTLEIVFEDEKNEMEDINGIENINSNAVKHYYRQLDLMNGLAEVSYSLHNTLYKREAFLSNPAKKLIYRIQTEGEDQINCNLTFDGGANPFTLIAEKERYLFCVKAHEKIHSDGQSGVTLWGCVKVKNTGGSVQYTEEGIKINGAKEVIITVEMKTDFAWPIEGDSCSWFPDDDLSYETRKEEHCSDFSSFMKRVNFTLEGDIKTELMFQYGRYLLLSSSREDSPLPTHLQGVWNDNVACRIGWTCDMHLDINTQMNYWLSEPANLTECHTPLFKWMEEQVIPSGRITAKESYGMKGWSADLVSNAWGFSAPYWSPTISPCPTGGIWMASDYWEHYLYTKDENFLREKTYPVLKEAVEFFVDYVFKNDGDKYFTSGPSISPENCFHIDGIKYYFSNGSTYEILMIRELFKQFIATVNCLNIEDDLTVRVKEILLGLLPFRILPDGSVAEWSHDYPAPDTQHRHTSHLLGLFPYSQITLETTPELAAAARKSIDYKLTPYENWEDTGWARSMLMLYAARLKEGEKAYFHIKSMQEHLTHPNLLVMHPPTRGAGSFKEVYELDGNTGFSMCVLELLIQSHDGIIRLLPALPEKWKTGSIQGILARGGVMVNMDWNAGGLERAELISKVNGTYKVQYKDKLYELELKAGEPVLVEFN